MNKINDDININGLLVGGSWINNEMDQYSDLDFIVVTKNIVSDDVSKIKEYANKFGNLLNCFTGEHVGEPRLLICLYDDPLIHVDLKFVVLEELNIRVEDPVILFDRDGSISYLINNTSSSWPKLDFQWIEDRFWTWIHYASLKIGRGEYFEALDFLSFLRSTVLSPMMQLKNNQLPRGMRKVEANFNSRDLSKLEITVATYNCEDIIAKTENAILLYKELREELFSESIILRTLTEKKCINYFYNIKERILDVQ